MLPKDILKWAAILVGMLTLLIVVVWFLFLRGGLSQTTERVSDRVVLIKIKDLGRLELIEYELVDHQKIGIDRTIGPKFFGQGAFRIGTDSLLLFTVGQVIGCIDLSKLDSTAIQVSDTLVRITLPAPEVCSFKLDFQKTQVVRSDLTLISRLAGDQAAVLDRAYARAEGLILKTALKQGIHAKTNQRAVAFFTPFLQGFGFKKVEVVTQEAK